MPVVYRDGESSAGWLVASLLGTIAILGLVAYFMWGQPRIDASDTPDTNTTIIQPERPNTEVVPIPVPSAPSTPAAPSAPAAPAAPAAPSGD